MPLVYIADIIEKVYISKRTVREIPVYMSLIYLLDMVVKAYISQRTQ